MLISIFKYMLSILLKRFLGHNSVETFELLLCYKAKYPDCVTLLRGAYLIRMNCRHH